jgi:hypothetical protein
LHQAGDGTRAPDRDPLPAEAALSRTLAVPAGSGARRLGELMNRHFSDERLALQSLIRLNTPAWEAEPLAPPPRVAWWRQRSSARFGTVALLLAIAAIGLASLHRLAAETEPGPAAQAVATPE